MFKKSVVVGVSVSPENGIEIAQVNYATGTVEKYGRKSIDYNIVKREIADLDLFKEALQELLQDMAIPKGTSLVLNFPTIAFRVVDYPASLDEVQTENAIEEDLYDNPYLQNYEPCYSYTRTQSTLQFNKYAYTALRKSSIVEIILSIKEMGYKVEAIDTSVNSLLHSLIYLDLVNTEPDTNWVLLTIENNCCRILSMLGRNYIDAFEEKISIGEVLSDAENYSTVISAVEPILKNLPSKYLCVISKTNVISAEVVANKLTYSSPIIYQEANCYTKEPFLTASAYVDAEDSKRISLDVIGAAIYSDFAKNTYANLNIFNKTLGDIYFIEQPLTIMGGKIVLTNQFLITIFILIAIAIIVLLIFILGWFAVQETNIKNNIDEMNGQIENIQKFIDANKDISASSFDEGDEIRIGLSHNKTIYSYYTIVGTEIPQKLWLTHLKLGDKITIDGQADNLESVYSFFRNIKDYNPKSDIRLQKLGLARLGSNSLDSDDIDNDIVLTSTNADFYEFSISNEIEQKPVVKTTDGNEEDTNKSKSNKKSKGTKNNLPDLEIIQ